MLAIVKLALFFAVSIFSITSIVLVLWKRSEERQLKERHARLRRMAQAYDPELVPWRSHMKPRRDEDDGA